MRQPNEIYLNGNNSTVQIASAHETSKTFSYNGNEVLFDIKDDVMVNATQLAKIYGKRPNDYLSLPATNQLISAITRKYGIAENQLVRTERGGMAPGTWMHRLIVVDFCQWLDIDLKLWCTEKLDELMRYGMTATQPTLEQMINNPDLVISLATQLKNEREEKARLEQEKKQLEEKNAKLKPKADFAEAAFKAEGKVDIGQAAKILNLGFGRNTLFKKLKEVGVFFKDRNEPKQKYIDAGYFEMTLLPPIHRDSHPDILYQKVLCKPKGLAYINQLFGGKPSDRKISPIK
jgi:phage antirepressor YoqD-like protein